MGRRSHILFLDSDMTFPGDTLARLLAHETDIVGLSYCSRTAPLRPLALRADHTHLHLTGGDAGLIEVGAVGFGVMLIRTDVFRTLAQPWFPVEWSTTFKRYTGEDIAFCERARHAGYTVYIDAALSRAAGHIGEMEYMLSHADQHALDLDARDDARRGILRRGH